MFVTPRWARALAGRLRRALGVRGGVRRLAPREAYRLWSQSYDAEPDNVMLILEEDLFAELFAGVEVTGRVVVDIGCGTGRHWHRLSSRRPSQLHGVDSSAEMLARLRVRHPDAVVHVRRGGTLTPFEDRSVDVVVSTLMLGYARCPEDELREWTRLLKVGGEIVLTEVHPDAIRAGMKRTFTHGGDTFEIEHSVVTLDALEAVFRALHLQIVASGQRALDETVRSVYERRGHSAAYRKDLGTSMVLGFRLRKSE